MPFMQRIKIARYDDCLSLHLFHRDGLVKKGVSYDSIMMTFTITIRTSKLTKIVHYSGYQQKLYDEVKRLKEIEGCGYRKISYILYEKGYRSVRTNSILRYNHVYSIYKKGKVREKRINREFKPVVRDIMVYVSK